MFDNLESLTELFRKLGAQDPEGWARDQLEFGTYHLGRYLFLKRAWSYVVEDGDRDWIERELNNAERDPTLPFSGSGLALKRLLSSGADPDDLTELVRNREALMLSSICCIIDEVMDWPDEPEEVSNLTWRLHLIPEENDEPLSPETLVGSLHESVIETDPTNREIRPK